MCSGGELRILKRLKPNRATGTENVAEEDDIISSLPDYLLIHILSFLGDTKQAARTSLLSKRWANVWTDLSEVDLHGNDFEIAKIKRFVDLVGSILVTCRKLDRFAVDFWYNNRFVSNVNSWFYFVIKRKVKNISFKFLFKYYELPQILFSYSLLEILTLSGCVMAPRGIISWGSLRSLNLTLDSITNDLMEKILSGCPRLEVLRLGSCRGLDNLTISSLILTTLEIEERRFSWGDNVVLDISAPYLRVLSICNKNPRLKFRLTHVSSVVQASFDFDGLKCRDEKIYMKELLINLQSIEKLKLGPRCSLIVSYMYIDGVGLPSFDKLKCLTLNVWRHALSIPAIEGMLRSSPNLETLLIRRIWNRFEEVMLDECEVKFVYYDDMYINASHLKTVKITDFTEQDLTAEYVLTLVKSLLENTNDLKEMIISLKEDPYHKYASSSTSADSSELAKRLLTFHRASGKAVVVLNL